MSKRVWFVYALAAASYLLLTLLIPVDPAALARYELSRMQGELLQLTITIPLIGIWFAAFYGYDRFHRYAQTIEGSKDGKAFKYIANGIGVLAITLPLSSILTTILNYLTRNSQDAVPAATIFSNYLAVLLALVAFWLIFRGSQELMTIVRHQSRSGTNSHNLTAAIVAVLAVLYTFVVFQNPYRQIPPEELQRATYHLPDWLILLTIIIPYVLVWLIGLRAIAGIVQYTRAVKGVIYRQVLGLLAKGVVAVVLLSILLQFLRNQTEWLAAVSLGPLLAILYLLLIGMAVGYLYVAAGARRLQKIEEV